MKSHFNFFFKGSLKNLRERGVGKCESFVGKDYAR